MHVFEFVLLIIVICSIAKLIEKAMDRRGARRESGRTGDADPEALDQRLEQLEERIRVLERIVTDQRGELHRQFRDLGS